MKRILIFSIYCLLVWSSSCGGVEPPQEPTVSLPDSIASVSPSEQESLGAPISTANKNEGDDSFLEYLTLTYPETIEPHLFGHSDYLLLVNQAVATDVLDDVTPVYSWAFLGESTDNFVQGEAYFKKLDDKYSKRYQFDKELFPYDLDDFEPEQQEFIQKCFFERHVVFVSSDGRRVLCTKFAKKDISGYIGEVFEGSTQVGTWWFDNYYTGVRYGEVYKLVLSDVSGHISESRDQYIPLQKGDAEGLHIHATTANCFNQQKDKYACINGPAIEVYSFPDNKLLSTFKMPDKKRGSKLVLSGFTADGRLVLTETELELTRLDGIEWDVSVYTRYSTSFVDIDGGTSEYVGSYMFQPMLSPDGKYMAYATPQENENFFAFDERSDEKKHGFFIMNLQTKETTFYPIYNRMHSDDSGMLYNIIGWVKKSGVDNLIKRTDY